MEQIDWAEGTWWNEPPGQDVTDRGLVVTTGDQTDLWRHTSYGFVHDTGHGLLAPLADGYAMECDVEARYNQAFDQAGMVVYASPSQWIKCGIEYADGVAQLGAVVTREVSDWSAGPVPDWASGVTSFRVSRSGDALTIRARRPGGAWQLVRLAPINPDLEWMAGPYAASPSRAGLEVCFCQWRIGPADLSLH